VDKFIRPGNPDFSDLPFDLPLAHWQGKCTRMEDVPRGITRHTVIFVNYDGLLYALKEMPANLAEQEYQLLSRIERVRTPAVTPVGFFNLRTRNDHTSILITRYLEHAIPYRSLFMTGSLSRYREHLLDAIAGLLVQLHNVGVYWGDCSLSNTLFRRDAGTLQAYLVDAETSSTSTNPTHPNLRHQDLDIMEENVDIELNELSAAGMLSEGFPGHDTGAYIRLRYQSLWEEITQEIIFKQGDSFHIQERIRALNALGFSVGGVDFYRVEKEEKIRLRVVVTDRNFHRDQLLTLTGLEAEEKQARLMVNEIQEVRASLSQKHNRETPLSVAGYHWLVNIFQPMIQILQPLVKTDMSTAELYCQLLEHKWYLSEQAQRDIGHEAAVKDYLQRFTQ